MSTASTTASAIGGSDIARVLGSSGPVVKAVLLKAGPDATIEELALDTTPSKQMAQQILGGPMTFLGQYEDEGIVLMIRKRNVLDDDDDEDDEDLFIRDEARAQLAELKISQLRKLCVGYDLDASKCIERSDLMDLILDDMERTMQSLPRNTHRLQPPLKHAKVRGDILVLRVAPTHEALDEIDSNSADAETIQKAMSAATPLSNEEFFQDYTKEECLAFLARTDIEDFELPPVVSSNEDEPLDGIVEEGEGDDDSDEEDDGDYMPCDDEDDGDVSIDEEDDDGYSNMDDQDNLPSMIQTVLNGVLSQYRNAQGREPTTDELTNIKSAIAAQFQVDVAQVDAAMKDGAV